MAAMASEVWTAMRVSFLSFAPRYWLGHALTEADEQVDGRAAGAYCGQRIAAQKVADDDGVGGVVELLEQVAKDERHREEQDTLPDAALGHEQGLFLLLCRVGHSSSLPQKNKVPRDIAQ